jgi:DNA-binding MarR family transcriptional regulator
VPEEELSQELTRELFDLSIAIDFVGQASATRLGINQTDLICLDLLVRQGPQSPSQIAATLGLTAAAISAMAGRLESGGYAHRKMDPTDRRRVLLHASPSGARRAFRLFDDLAGAAAEMYTRYPERDLRKLLDMLRAYRQLIDEHAAALRADPGRR